MSEMKIVGITGTILFSAAVDTIKQLVVKAVEARANLYGANLYEANLRGVDLREANLYGADLREANLYGADLRGVDLREANLYGANLYEANLRGVDLREANLRGVDLYGADLREADLREANLREANLYGANLYEANLRGADLREANLRGAKNAELIIARLQFIPIEGAFYAWKKCRNGVIVKLQVPEDAKRSHATERKCRCSKAIVIDVFNGQEGVSLHDKSVVYRKGETILPDAFDENRWNVCAPGIHFYITREEAEAHQ